MSKILIAYATVEGHSTDQDVKRDYDYTDYDAVRRFAAEVASTPRPEARAGAGRTRAGC